MLRRIAAADPVAVLVADRAVRVDERGAEGLVPGVERRFRERDAAAQMGVVRTRQQLWILRFRHGGEVSTRYLAVVRGHHGPVAWAPGRASARSDAHPLGRAPGQPGEEGANAGAVCRERGSLRTRAVANRGPLSMTVQMYMYDCSAKEEP